MINNTNTHNKPPGKPLTPTYINDKKISPGFGQSQKDDGIKYVKWFLNSFDI